LTAQHDCDHRWGRHLRGDPLECLDCGLLWPAVDDWPPSSIAVNPGYGDLDGFVPWARRVERMADELQEV
jgi:hypothetical protein